MQYLLNVTAIWLLSLILFDVFLKKETYHQYNRLYLVGTFIAGIIIPLLPLLTVQNTMLQYAHPIGQSAQEFKVLKEYIAKSATPETTTTVVAEWQVNWRTVLWYLYLAGAIVGLSLLICDSLKLYKYYRQGPKTSGNSFILIETGKTHGPFSFFNSLFVSNRSAYTNDQWAIIIRHELKHKQQYHVIDIFLVQLGRILFWFHPLVYVYQKRVLLLHEYQADTTANDKTQYGTFLLEQSLLSSAPAITHSFNRSPIKKRILMLTRRSSTASKKCKLLLLLPLLMLIVSCFNKNKDTSNLFSTSIQVIEGDTIEWGNHIDSVNHGDTTVIIHRPLRLNGKELLTDTGLSVEPKIVSTQQDLLPYLQAKILENGIDSIFTDSNKIVSSPWHLSNLVVDQNGEILTFKFWVTVDEPGTRKYDNYLNNATKKVDEIIKGIKVTTAIQNGKPVPYLITQRIEWGKGIYAGTKTLNLPQ